MLPILYEALDFLLIGGHEELLSVHRFLGPNKRYLRFTKGLPYTSSLTFSMDSATVARTRKVYLRSVIGVATLRG